MIYKEKQWRHLNFFQYHCYIHASVPRVKCPEHGFKQAKVPWARKGSAFTLLFEQAALTLGREMPVNAAARIIDIHDKRLWCQQRLQMSPFHRFEMSGFQRLVVG